MELDATLRIMVGNGEHFFPDRRVAIQLFPQFAPKTICQRFARFALAAGKFPVTFKMNPAWPTGDEERVIALDDSGGDDDSQFLSEGLRPAESARRALARRVGGSRR